jgi:hypothetical protein
VVLLPSWHTALIHSLRCAAIQKQPLRFERYGRVPLVLLLQHEPPDGYRLIQEGLHRATTSMTPANVVFLEKLGLKTVLNMGPGLLLTRSPLGSFVAREGIKVVSEILKCIGPN